jgi:uncharacterized SAM-binding protein YcdF (DUF218 family)
MLRLWRWISRALALTGAVVLLVTFTPLIRWSCAALSMPWSDSDGDVLILLGGSTVDVDGVPGSAVAGTDTYWRTLHAAYAWHHGHFHHLVVSGLDTARTIQPLLAAMGVPRDAITVENASRTTRENVLALKPILDRLEGRKVLVTSDYHSYRASRCFAKVGIAVQTRPAPDLGRQAASLAGRWSGLWVVVKEVAKIGWYRWRGWI